MRELSWVVLQIGVHGHDELTGRDLDSRCQRRRLAEVPAQANNPDVEVRGVEPHELSI
jgi:hypothetical protein